MAETAPEHREPSVSPAAVVACARGWIGTPYRHQASLRGVGCDCLGLVRGIWRELLGPEPEPPPPYPRSWAEDGDAGLMIAAARRNLVERPIGPIAPGDVLLFRVRRDGPARHAGVATGPDAMVHAYDGHAVAETPIPDTWRRRLVARFVFPLP
ncbi:NlpC/P60 family protein [Methylopila turkensis]|uniref:Peptidase n=1 Tax=Methylopila turkensis TaxID=1437816 RepID=A0A9W6JS62_9HYPH|nr:NlpC/P60 family protein [Methylopila turkensis]GLK81438.1 peptidase [Methylopila turkensis]